MFPDHGHVKEGRKACFTCWSIITGCHILKAVSHVKAQGSFVIYTPRFLSYLSMYIFFLPAFQFPVSSEVPGLVMGANLRNSSFLIKWCNVSSSLAIKNTRGHDPCAFSVHLSAGGWNGTQDLQVTVTRWGGGERAIVSLVVFLDLNGWTMLGAARNFYLISEGNQVCFELDFLRASWF
jgi:hypothetical protein